MSDEEQDGKDNAESAVLAAVPDLLKNALAKVRALSNADSELIDVLESTVVRIDAAPDAGQDALKQLVQLADKRAEECMEAEGDDLA